MHIGSTLQFQPVQGIDATLQELAGSKVALYYGIFATAGAVLGALLVAKHRAIGATAGAAAAIVGTAFVIRPLLTAERSPHRFGIQTSV